MNERRSSVGNAIAAALRARDPFDKVMLARAAARDWRLGRLDFVFETPLPERPGRPDTPQLLHPRDMPRRGKAQSAQTRIALFHALAHIEFVAIDLALDMAGRFGADMGAAFVGDFLSVAGDEAMHFVLLERHLRTMGSHYGALPAHDGLWGAAHDTRHDVTARLAIVPMVLEARGLDVTPGMLQRVRSAGDRRGARILSRILDDEIRHVAIGTRHFVNGCERRGEHAPNAWKSLIKCYFKGGLKPPFNDSARLAAGLSRQFYAEVEL